VTGEDFRFRLDVTQRPSAGQLERDAEALRAWRDCRATAVLLTTPDRRTSRVTAGARHAENRAVTTTGPQLALRTPVWIRALGTAFVLAWLYPLASDPPRAGFLLLAAILAVVLTVFVVRMSICHVVATVDGRLRVRNVWSTRTFGQDEIDGVVIDRADARLREGWAVILVLADGSRHPLDVTAAPFLGQSVRRLERQAEEVRAWLDGRPQPVR
jgi:hypothetical protein